MHVSLPKFYLPALRPTSQALWAATRQELRLADSPTLPDFARPRRHLGAGGN